MQSHDLAQNSESRRSFDRALAELQATLANFASACIRESRVRMQYVRDIAAMARAVEADIRAGRLSLRDAAEQAVRLRNEILDLSRTRSSPVGRAYAMSLKEKGLTLGELVEKNAAKLFGRSAATLTESELAAIYAAIARTAGSARRSVVESARLGGVIGKRLWLVALAVAVYEIGAAENRPHEVVRQGVLVGAGIAGGSVLGAGAVAAGVCAATAPVCVGLAAVVGGLIFAFGADIGLGTIYPRPTVRR